MEDLRLVHDLVFDVGAHKGEDSAFYLKLGFRVVGVEANPYLAKELKNRFRAEIESGRYHLIDQAIGESEGETAFYVNKVKSVWGTTDSAVAQRNKIMGAESDRIAVMTVRFEDLLRTFGCPHYLKIDIEGADMLCVNSLRRLTAGPNLYLLNQICRR